MRGLHPHVLRIGHCNCGGQKGNKNASKNEPITVIGSFATEDIVAPSNLEELALQLHV